MRIVHLTWGLGIGGAEAMLGDIAGEQSVAHDVQIIIGNSDVDPSIASGIRSSVRLKTLGRPPGSASPWYLIKLILWLWWINPDVVHAHQESFGRLGKLIRSPMLLTVHNTRLSLSRSHTAYDSVCCISEAVKDDVLSRFPEKRPRVIRNGINFEAVKIKRRYGGCPFRVVQVGRLAHDQKGQDLLIRALPRVLDELGNDAVRLDFIGEGDSLDYLQRLIVECGVEAHCRFLGALTRRCIYGRLHEYDLLVQPSRYEGFGLTVVEGIAAGLPVLVSDIEGPREIVAQGQLGWCFRSEDAEDLSGKMLELIALSRQPGFPTLMQTRLDRARRRFDVKLTAAEYIDEYARLSSLET
ncbi:MAG: glycosyltransferase [Steroidobacteraceae bacterium]|jgi:glycosyltransferase involved in cell wall biosynthesis